ncbi:hypothetical protein LXA43DRAFT_1168263, partial [Ganoderma leucocontextum]
MTNSSTGYPEVNHPVVEVLQSRAPHLNQSLTIIFLSSVLLGILTVLTGTSLYFVMSKSLRRASAMVLAASTLLLYASTATYCGGIMRMTVANNRVIESAADALLLASAESTPNASRLDSGTSPLTAAWLATISLTVNVLIGDAIVWWRACVLWRNQLMCWLGPLLLAAALALELVGASIQAKSSPPDENGLPHIIGAHPYAAMTAGLSLAINLLATSLIGIKAWSVKHRVALHGHFGEDKDGRKYVVKVLLLLVETGVVYLILVTFMMVYLAINQTTSRSGRAFADGFHAFMYGCAVPIVAIYPTAIIFIIALDQSQLAQALRTDSSNATLTEVAVNISVVETSDVG